MSTKTPSDLGTELPPIPPSLSMTPRPPPLSPIQELDSPRNSSDTSNSDTPVSSLRSHSTAKATTRDLTRLLKATSRENRALQRALISLTAQLRSETQRADDAERKVIDTALQFKVANDARITAQKDVARLTQELRGYQIQFDHAQKEIYRAQDVLNAIDERCYKAEESAAHARDVARRLTEERIMFQAREDGRQVGFHEGVSKGKQLGFEEGRRAGYEEGRIYARTRRYVYDDVIDEHEIPSPLSLPRDARFFEEDADSPHDMEESVDSGSYTESRPVSQPPVIPIIPSAAAAAGMSMRTFTPSTTTHTSELPATAPPPVSKQPSPSPRHVATDIPPDGWIPQVDADNRIRLPPPHEMNRTTPAASPAPSAASTKPLPQDENNTPLRVPPGPSGGFYRRPMHNRSSSYSSQESAGLSQLDIIGTPLNSFKADKGKDRTPTRSRLGTTRDRERELSMIPEAVSPSVVSKQPSHATMKRDVTPILRKKASMSSSSSMSGYYQRPQSSSSESSMSVALPEIKPPARPESVATVPDINIEPPSRVQSITSDPRANGTYLSPADANRPIPLPASQEDSPPSAADEFPTMSNPPVIVGVASAGANKSPTPISSVLKTTELPLGFIPSGPPAQTPVSTYAASVAGGGSNGRYLASGQQTPVGLPAYISPSHAGSAISSAAGAAPPSVAGPGLRRSRHSNADVVGNPYASPAPNASPGASARGGGPSPLPSSSPMVAVIPGPELRSRPGRQSYSSSSSSSSGADDKDEMSTVSSRLSGSLDSLTTPPAQRAKRLPSKSNMYDAGSASGGGGGGGGSSWGGTTPVSPLAGLGSKGSLHPQPSRSSMVKPDRSPRYGLKSPTSQGKYERFDGGGYLDPAFMASSDNLKTFQ